MVCRQVSIRWRCAERCSAGSKVNVSHARCKGKGKGKIQMSHSYKGTEESAGSLLPNREFCLSPFICGKEVFPRTYRNAGKVSKAKCFSKSSSKAKVKVQKVKKRFQCKALFAPQRKPQKAHAYGAQALCAAARQRSASKR